MPVARAASVRWLSCAVVLAVVAPLGLTAPAAYAAGHGKPPAPQHFTVIAHTTAVLPGAEGEPAAASGVRPDSSWPGAGSATVALPALPAAAVRAQAARATGRSGGDPASFAATAGGTRAGSLPVLVERSAASGGPSGVSVNVLSHSQAAAAGVDGVLLTVSSASAAGGPVSLGVDYSSFANAGGAGFGDRARLVSLPACALTTPDVPACQVQTPVAGSVNDGTHQTVAATVTLPADAAADGGIRTSAARSDAAAAPAVMRVLALTDGASGANGSFSAASLSPSGTWTGGGASGDFTWQYPISVPASTAGAAPTVSLDYNSADVDGRQATTNNQYGLIGEGFDLSASYIQRTYPDCADDPEGAIAKDYDNCWAASQVVTMSLNGQSVPLVVDSSGKWHEQADSGDQIQYLTNQSGVDNGTYDNDYWLVTTPDGTQYYFGKNKGPGWAAGDPTTDSVLTEPVYGAHSGDPCYNSTFASASCTQAYQWNLDFVVDAHDNASAYYYTQETNYYGADQKTTGVIYDRASYPTVIQYGLRDESGSIYNAPADRQVSFTTAERCIPTSTFTCDPAQFNATNATDWPDTPQTLQCAKGATCNNNSPTFWSTKRVTAINTQDYTGGATNIATQWAAGTTGWNTIDDYAFTQSFPTTGDPEMLLNTIVRTGYAGSNSLALPPVKLGYQLLDNRIPGYNSEPPMAHWRLTSIETETGETIGVTYNNECTTSQIPSNPSANTGLCYPVDWIEPYDTNPTLDYFNKYTVSQVEVQDGTAGSPAQFTNYTYLGGAAWHYDDNQLVPAAQRTYGQFRGFAQVEAVTGNANNTTDGTADPTTETLTSYYRGMNGDVLPNNGSRSATVKDTHGGTVTDSDQFADQPFEVQVFNGPGGAQVSDTVTDLTTVAVTGTETVSGLPAVQATIIAPASVTTYTDLAGGGTTQSMSKTTYDSFGRTTMVDTTGTDVAETCTQTTYADNTALWIRQSPSEVVTAAQACPSTVGNLTASDILSDTRTYYDGSTTLGSLTGPGNATEVQKATVNNNGTLTFAVASKTAYDASGRTTSATDGDNHTTTTAYTPADGGLLTGVTVTNALNQASSTALDPARGSKLSSTDVAGYVTSESYDPLGRVTAVWEPGHSQSGGAQADITYSYQTSDTKPLAVTTNTLVDYGTGTDYTTEVSIYDSLGNLRQTQTETEGGDMVATDTFYNSDGWVAATNNKYVTTGSPSPTLISVATNAVNDNSVTTYDGDGRAVSVADYNGTTLTDTTDKIYDGNSTTTIEYDANNNVIGTPTTTKVDVAGAVTQTVQYATAPTVSGLTVSGGTPQATTSTFNAAGEKTAVADPKGNTWSYSYDMLGRQTGMTDPDSGTQTTQYDLVGNVTATTNADGVSDNYVYDALNRKVGAYTGSTTQGSGTKTASWVYDTMKKGKLTYSASIVNGQQYLSGVLGYDTYGDTTGTAVQVPATVPGLAGTYKTTMTTSSTGLLLSETPAQAGGLPAETINYTYDGFGNPTTEVGYDTYVSGAAWSPFGDLSQADLGTGPSAAWLSYTYSAQNQDITDINLSDLNPTPQVDDLKYNYNADQQVTSETDTEGAAGTAPVETQCFGYDMLDRLNQAWTATDGCAANPQTNGGATVGGPQPYWQSWTFDPIGDRLSETDHATSGGTVTSTTTTADCYAAAGHSHALSATVTAAGTTVPSCTGATDATSYGYDPSGNMTTRDVSTGNETLKWDQNEKLSTVTTPAGQSSFVYDVDGNELTSTTTGSSTLYLDGEQITYTTSSKALTGVRYYSFGGQTIAEGTGTSLFWTEADVQNTHTVLLNAFNQNSVTRRTTSPYGVVLNTAGTWVDDRTFLNDPTDPNTGLVDVGARKYDPGVGDFISVDAELNPSQPQSMIGYGYGADNPICNPDPSGDSWWSAVTNVVNKVAQVASVVAPVLNVVAVCTAAIPGVDVVTAGLAAGADTVAEVSNIAAGAINTFNGARQVASDIKNHRSILKTALDIGTTAMSAMGGGGGDEAAEAEQAGESVAVRSFAAKAGADNMANAKQIDYFDNDGDELVNAVHNQRIADDNPNNNYAAARYIDQDGNAQIAVERSSGRVKGLNQHGEGKLFRTVDGTITDVYSELKPCANRCGPMIDDYDHPVNVTYSWDWSDSAGGASARAAQQQAARMVLRMARMFL